MMTTGFFHDERTLWHFGAIHTGNLPTGGWVQPSNGNFMAEAPDPKRRVVSLLEVSGVMAMLDRRSAPLASEEAMRRVHGAEYLARFAELSANAGGSVGPDASFGPGGFDVARLSAGLATAAVEAVLSGELDNAYAMTRPPGHHCLPDQGYGFCLLANAAIAVEEAITRHGLSRVAILDWDVHHGNGTQAIFYDRPDVLTISVHQEGCYPINQGAASEQGAGRGDGCNINVPLLPGGGHQAYVDAMALIIAPALRRYRPELIVIACGFDPNALDPLARMLAHSDTFRMLMGETKTLAAELCGGRLVAIHEGGYSEVYVPFCAQALIEELAGTTSAVVDPVLEFVRAQQPNTAFQGFQRQLLADQADMLGLKAG